MELLVLMSRDPGTMPVGLSLYMRLEKIGEDRTTGLVPDPRYDK